MEEAFLTGQLILQLTLSLSVCFIARKQTIASEGELFQSL
jgi:hypothetical protein